jgi:hypothetical protein
MAAAPAVRECHNVTGAVEYLLRVEWATSRPTSTFTRRSSAPCGR